MEGKPQRKRRRVLTTIKPRLRLVIETTKRCVVKMELPEGVTVFTEKRS